jgi:hypothetical protein
MVKFVEVSPDEIPQLRESRRGRVSYPILKTFMETGMTMAQLDRQGIQQSLQSLSSSLTAYIRNHNLPIKMFTRKGQIYLMRTDTNEEGDAMPIDLDRYQPPAMEEEELADDDSIPFVDVEIKDGSRFKRERGQTTK